MKVIGFAAVLYLVSIVAADGGGGGGGSESEAPKEQSQSGDGEHSSLDGRIPALDSAGASSAGTSEEEEIPDPARWLHQTQVADSARIAYLKATFIKKAADKYNQDAHKYHGGVTKKLSKTQERLVKATESLDNELSGNLREIQMQLPDS
ncbi:hypothetical protein BASA50_007784 [Batrachochytrium salamandrivorans]|uniref:Uncharacterized protein n=1 Tax=Batrachochytrium salamandrivorans TaxID=1357716 RepID=A0ABQ8F632_9FUNG|nr:hypothetical protein BASA50_007784 [Batrachochytrium salamandrivorans]